MSTDQPEFAIGDHVRWTHTTMRGSMGIDMRTWEGKVTKVGVHHLWIKRRGKTHVVHRDHVTKAGQTSHLTKMITKEKS